jgi:hypothetical protein
MHQQHRWSLFGVDSNLFSSWFHQGLVCSSRNWAFPPDETRDQLRDHDVIDGCHGVGRFGWFSRGLSTGSDVSIWHLRGGLTMMS